MKSKQILILFGVVSLILGLIFEKKYFDIIIKYTIDNLDEITQENKTVNYEEMKAKIDFYNYEAFLSSNNLEQKSANRNNGDPCPSYNYPNPGDNGVLKTMTPDIYKSYENKMYDVLSTTKFKNALKNCN